jgi:hypothetical protein
MRYRMQYADAERTVRLIVSCSVSSTRVEVDDVEICRIFRLQ